MIRICGHPGCYTVIVITFGATDTNRCVLHPPPPKGTKKP